MRKTEYIVIAKESGIKELDIPFNNRIGVQIGNSVTAVNGDWNVFGVIEEYFYSLTELEEKISQIENTEKIIELLSKSFEALSEANKLLRG